MAKILVMSAGHGGQAMAGDLAIRGHDVTLYEHPDFAATVDAINARGRVITLENKISGRGRLRLVTTDAAEALKGAAIVYFTAPSFAQKPFFDLALPYFEDGQIVVLSPGNYGTFALKRGLDALGKKVFVGELDNLPYVCTAKEPGLVDVKSVKRNITLATLPMRDYDHVNAAMKDAYVTTWKRGVNVLDTSMAGINMVLHCLPMLMNCGAIDNGKDFRFYSDGMPPLVCAAMEAFDKERLAVGAAFGLGLPDVGAVVRGMYGVSGDGLHAVIQNNTAYTAIPAPKTMKHRFLTEDVPFSLVPTIAFGDLAGVETPVMDATLALCSLVMGGDQRAVGQNLDAMGLGGKNLNDIDAML
ncbi:MAG: NAD/NADP octopine/nopaline dehydrogenase family protein [Deltaproteobacteria bacterium]|nr:NAD/NADP octopine/nopaline dehydrogenase family protein [Deltaproteobacteria bacterium]